MISRYLTGLNPLAYGGVNSIQPPDLVFINRDPTPRDINYNIGTIWLAFDEDIYILVDNRMIKNIRNAVWINLYPTQSGGLISIQTDNGVATQNGSNQINMLGDGELFATRATSANSVSIELNESLAYYFLGNTGSAIADNNKLQIIGNTKTLGAPIVTIASGDTVNILQSGTTANTFTADDTNTAVPNSGNINIYGQTDLLNTSATDSTVTVNLTDSLINGQLLVGGGGTGVAWASLDSSDGSVTIDTTSPNSIDLSVTNQMPDFGTSMFYAYLASPAYNANPVSPLATRMGFQQIARPGNPASNIVIVKDSGENWTNAGIDGNYGYYTCPYNGIYQINMNLNVYWSPYAPSVRNAHTLIIQATLSNTNPKGSTATAQMLPPARNTNIKYNAVFYAPAGTQLSPNIFWGSNGSTAFNNAFICNPGPSNYLSIFLVAST